MGEDWALSWPHKPVNVGAMRHASLRSVLIAFTALTAAPAFAQEAPPVADPAPRIQDVLPEPSTPRRPRRRPRR